MISEKILELIHKEIDGQITSSEKDELQTYLRDNPEAKLHYKQLYKTVNTVEELDDIEPGIDLKNRIMESIEWKESYKDSEKYDRNVFLPGIFANPRVRQVVTFSFGFIFCFLLITVLFKDPFRTRSADPQLLIGTIGIERLDTYAFIDSLIYETDLGSITVNRKVGDSINIFHANVDRIQNATVQFHYDPLQLEFAGYYPLDPSANRVTKIDSVITVSSSSASDYILVFDRSSNERTSIGINVYSGNISLVNKTFIIDQDY
jgi:hypothetical protein